MQLARVGGGDHCINHVDHAFQGLLNDVSFEGENIKARVQLLLQVSNIDLNCEVKKSHYPLELIVELSNSGGSRYFTRWGHLNFFPPQV